ncbi:MAG: aromatic acid decarboxylase [Nitrospirae bacterium CG_4_10_14_0_8_um_filter_41_23]|nr:UbiX family flavin prenyltransferase [Nitrospirota bacterium]OIP61369.1 MAG: aromatic acid decarboxylase [Nitrospirae bacterium CG2_30_41_42]PIQ94579.1 MAG: aromatic acid decarboxylase [Nitrospirae bacterium CG11_big_fil_rev_8_21_14_0_20_41_14]PIV41308.1 MAG: aromatic acid decarboxylase [Nitrospirae bacterium CG02_land_8_20_14_3_00_41_53]PIW87695.1 MAG: aromatic acid decarboxylase [Nitrospirae bacterium CG_4_8_14_3_um_filter_41_47]PIY86545.1 MAG: aromatic acid decarboxylase [Nitrospirae bac
MSDYVIGITGASGSIYGVRLIQELGLRKQKVNVVITSAGKKVMHEELQVSSLDQMDKLGLSEISDQIKIWGNDDFNAPFMSGSNVPEAVIIIPCSMGKLASVANGISGNLLERIADVALKEKRQLILVVRETPLSLIHLENMVKVARAGAQILPAMPAFYHYPKTVDDMINFVVGKVLNLLRIEHNLFKGWRKE